jgi:hypothetical protein
LSADNSSADNLSANQLVRRQLAHYGNSTYLLLQFRQFQEFRQFRQSNSEKNLVPTFLLQAYF